MIEAIRIRWQRFTPREKMLVTIMLILAALVFLWLGVLRPLFNGLSDARAEYGAALDRHVRVVNKVAAIKGTPNFRTGYSNPAPLDVVIAQSAGEAGFAVDRNEAKGGAQTDVAIANVRAQAMLRWLAVLEGQGIFADTLAIQGNEGGTVSLTATFKRAGK